MSRGAEGVPGNGDSIVDYEKPPVVEVVCGITFKPLEELLAPQFGLFWQQLREEYPQCREVSPLVHIVETYDAERVDAQVELRNVPPLPRIWFVSKEEHFILQLQRDRFLHNWRKLTPDDDYPRYGKVIARFCDMLDQFRAFLAEEGIPKYDPVQYEMTYINHMPLGDGWASFGEVGRVFPDFAWRHGEERFLPAPEAMNWQTRFRLPDRQGRLYASIKRGARGHDGHEILILEMTVRGFPGSGDSESMKQWFGLAREWIVRGFADITGEGMQDTVWRKHADPTD